MPKFVGLKKEVRVCMNELLDNGWNLVRHSNHLIFKKENNTIVISKSPSDRRFYKNIKSIIKKSKTSGYEQMFIN